MVGVHCGVWVSEAKKSDEPCTKYVLHELVDLDNDQSHDEVHHGGIKLQTQVGGTNMENATQNSLQKEKVNRKFPLD